MRSALSAALVFGALSAPAAADVRSDAQLSSTEETTSSTSTATGTAELKYDRTTGFMDYDVEVIGMVGTAAHIHSGNVGVAGPIVYTLVGGPTSWVGSVGPLTPAEVDAMLHEGWYVNVHSAAFPLGEIRGQVRIRQHLRAHPNEAEETPPTGSSATAIADLFVALPSGDLSYTVTATGLAGTAAHIHTGLAGVQGPITFPLAGGPAVWSGSTGPLTNMQLLDLLSGEMYVNIHTAAFPLGEIRGQIETGGLNAASSKISLAVGGTQHMNLEMGAALAGQLYWILGTTTGTTPGLAAGGGLVLPLNFSGYLLFGITNLNLLPTPSLAFLDITGAGASDWTIVPGLDPGLAGTMFNHAYVTLDVLTLSATRTSNAIPLLLVP